MTKPHARKISVCVVYGCNKERKSNGLCAMHAKRLERHGHINAARPEDWGLREKHPLYGQWTWMRRNRGRYNIHPAWDDFWVFVKDIGNRPSRNHRLKRINRKGDYSPENYKWNETIPNKNNSEYMKLWRAKNPEKAKNNDLKKSFGISIDEYNAILDEQNGVCAICGNKDKTYHKLPVDHCHKTGGVRGLLCTKCNRGLGLFNDSVEILEKAIWYLKNNRASENIRKSNKLMEQ